jgi:hypothetical protein
MISAQKQRMYAEQLTVRLFFLLPMIVKARYQTGYEFLATPCTFYTVRLDQLCGVHHQRWW